MGKLREKYGEEIFNLEGIGEQLNLEKFSDNYFNAYTTADTSVDENANVSSKTVVGYTFELPKPYFKLYSMYKLWKEVKEEYGEDKANEIIEQHVSGDMYLHDLYTVSQHKPYCFNFSTFDVIEKGLPMIKKIKSVPPKHLFAFKSQIEQFSIIAANSIAGATGLGDFLLACSFYIGNLLENLEDSHFKFASEEDAWKYVEETFTSFIYTMNQPTRASQSIFSNVSVYDRVNLESLKDDYTYPDGSTLDIELVSKVQKLFLKCMNNALKRTPLTFPVITACVSVDKDGTIADKDFIDMIAEENEAYGFINIFNGSSSTVSGCCRLRSDTTHEFFNSFGAGRSKIGSVGVASINFPRIAYRAINEDNPEKYFYKEATKLIKNTFIINDTKRKIIQKAIDNGMHPLYSLGFMDLKKQYSTVGINGWYEALVELGYDITKADGVEFTVDFMEYLTGMLNEADEKYGYLHNVEQVPGENFSVKAAYKDYVLGYQDKYRLYSNQFIPLIENTNILNRIKVQGQLDKHFSGGSVLHLNIGYPLKKDEFKDLTYMCAEKGVVYWAANYVLKECSEGHMTAGNGDKCDICGSEIVNEYTRVVGFLVNTKNFNKVRREHDYPERKWYDENSVV